MAFIHTCACVGEDWELKMSECQFSLVKKKLKGAPLPKRAANAENRTRCYVGGCGADMCSFGCKNNLA